MHNQLEKYLSQIEKQLAALPAEQRQDELREIRSHLEMMIEDNVARGCEMDEAVVKAIRQFGAAERVGRDLNFPIGNERSFLLKYRFKVFRLLACIVAVEVMFHYFPSISLSSNNWWSIVIAFLLGWMIAFFGRPKTISFFRMCVMFCFIIIITFYRVSSGFTSPQDFTMAAFFAGYLLSRWQKNWHSVVAN